MIKYKLYVNERFCYCIKIKVFYVFIKIYGIEDSLDSIFCKLIEKENNKIFVWEFGKILFRK